MSEELTRLAIRIRENLPEIEIVLQRIQEGWQRCLSSSDDYYLDGVALNLHGLYSGLERIFESVAVVIDGGKPGGENWHLELLKQMATEIPEVRPVVISEDSFRELNEYRGFRHIVRNVYAYRFEPEKITRLVERAPGMFFRVKAELLAFSEFLEGSSDE
jgi:hypothetical protein